MERLLAVLLAAVIAAAGICTAASVEEAPPSSAPQDLKWPEATSECRPWAYHWWMGSGVDKGNLTREFERYRDAGMGGVHVVPIYGAKGFEQRYLEYLSPEWMEMLAHAVAEARRLGMGLDMTTGSGWCFGGPNVPAGQANARVVLKTFDVVEGKGVGEKLDPRATQAVVAVPPAAKGAVAGDGRCVELTDRIASDGSLAWIAEGGKWRVYAVSQQPTGRMVKRAAPGGEGHMLNPFYGNAIRNYLDRFTRAFADYRGPKPRAMYHDSYEYFCDWSPDLFAEFQRRRGYRLQTELPRLFGTASLAAGGTASPPAGSTGGDDRTARVKYDYRRTVSDMMVENVLPAWVEWAHELGCITRNQAHGSPGNLLDLYAAADVPETEMFRHDRDPLVAKFASSAAHVSAKRLVGAETGTWLAEHFTETLAEMKRAVDEMFVAGVNHVIYHGTCYSPDDAPWPGWLFYASTEMNPRNSIWRDVAALNAYVARCQSILQSGRADNDLLLYWPIHDFWHNPQGMVFGMSVHRTDWLHKQPIGAVARRLWQRGFAFDYVSDRQLVDARAGAGRVVVPGGSFRAIVVPACERMPLATLDRLLTLAGDGAAVVFQDHVPRDVPGLADLERRRAELKQRLDRLATDESDPKKLHQVVHGRGQILVGDVEAALARLDVGREKLVDRPGLRCIRRAGRLGRHYFIVNHGSVPLDDWVPLATEAAAAVLMDPMTGRVAGAAVAHDDERQTRVYLQLAPGESVVLRTFGDKEVAGPPQTYVKRAGKPAAVTGTWHVEFIEGGPKLPAAYRTDALQSWADRDDGEARRFAGAARYTIALDRPPGSDRCLLDLGRVCQSARVRVNGRDLGTFFASPFHVVLDGLKPRHNVLEIEVTNVSANRIRDLDRRGVVWRKFHNINFVNVDYKPFDASEWPLHDSGLLGPVTLQPVVAVQPTWPPPAKR